VRVRTILSQSSGCRFNYRSSSGYGSFQLRPSATTAGANDTHWARRLWARRSCHLCLCQNHGPLHGSLRAVLWGRLRPEYRLKFELVNTPHTFISEATEYRGHSGDSDYLVACLAHEFPGDSPRVYIWEAKAPQCYLFERETKNRVCPTKELVKAENQLLHYYDESKGSAQFRDEFKIGREDDVRLGGIIIGTRSRLVKSRNYDPETSMTLALRALRIRSKYFYRENGIRVMGWDYLLDSLNPNPPVVGLAVELRDSLAIRGTINIVSSK
jgi:hypothetical protein